MSYIFKFCFVYCASIFGFSSLGKSEECTPTIFPKYGPRNTLITFENLECFNSTKYSLILNETTYLKLRIPTLTLECNPISYVPILKLDGSFFNHSFNWKLPYIDDLSVSVDTYNQNFSISVCAYNDVCRLLNETKFQLKIAPIINESVPIIYGKSILSGGIFQIFSGLNFDSVANPYMDVFTRSPVNNLLLVDSFLFFPKINNPQIINPNALCKVESDRLTCSVPRMNFIQNYNIADNGLLPSYMLLNFGDGNNFNSGKQFFEKDFYKLYVTDDPQILTWDPLIKDYPANDRPHSFLIRGSKFLQACNESDYRIKVGNEDVQNSIFSLNVISFWPPSSEPSSSLSDINSAKPVKLYVGQNVEIVIGYIQYNPKTPDWYWIVGLACSGAVLIILAIIIVCWMYRRHKILPEPLIESNAEQNPYIHGDGIMGYIPLPSSLESKKIEFSNLEITKKIAQGNYGQVLLAILKNDKSTVAVKTALEKDPGRFVDPGQIKDIYAEATVMKDITHPNVMNLIGICLDERNIPYIVLPYMANGDLKNFLQRPKEIFTFEDLLRFGLDVLRGMEFLNALKIIHRDLAARNCMVSATRLVKVSDFGLSRKAKNEDADYYKPTREDIALPVKWLAIECFDERSRKFTEKSDVWSFGVLMYEILTRGAQPYSGVLASEIYKYIKLGRRLDNPGVEEEIYDSFMWRSWMEDPEERPTFSELRSAMERKLSIEESSYLKPII